MQTGHFTKAFNSLNVTRFWNWNLVSKLFNALGIKNPNNKEQNAHSHKHNIIIYLTVKQE